MEHKLNRSESAADRFLRLHRLLLLFLIEINGTTERDLQDTPSVPRSISPSTFQLITLGAQGQPRKSGQTLSGNLNQGLQSPNIWPLPEGLFMFCPVFRMHTGQWTPEGVDAWRKTTDRPLISLPGQRIWGQMQSAACIDLPLSVDQGN